MTDYAAKLAALEAGALRPAEFSHLDHIGVAWEALSRHEFFDAAARYARGLRALAEAAGAPRKYNATLTFAAMSLIAERMAADPCDSAAAFVARNGAAFTKGFMTAQYDDARIASDLARATPLLPGRQFSAPPG